MSQNNQINSGSNNHDDSELQHSSVDTNMNVTFVEEQPLVADDARLGYSLSKLPPTLEQAMPDEHWMAAQQLSKPIVIRQFQWTADDQPNTILNSFNFPSIIAENDTLQKETLQMYSFFKMNWNLKFQVNGTKFHSGQLIVSFDPFWQAADAITAVGQTRAHDIVYATGLPHVLLNASSNEPVQIELPFVHPRNFLTTNSVLYDILGRVRVTVMNPLRYATGSSAALSITVWLFATDPSVHVPIYRHDYKPVTLNDFEQSMEVLGKVGELLNVGKDAAGAYGNAMTGNVGGAIKSGLSSLTGLGSMLGLDYPTRIVHPQSHINSLGPMPHGKGVDQSLRLSLEPASGVPPSPEQTGTEKDECDFHYIKKVPMLFRQVVWNDSATAGTVLTYFPVTPNLCARGGYGNNASLNTYLSWFSNLFNFWRGSIDFHFEWVSTQFHTGRVLISFIPNLFPETPTLQQAFSCPNAVVDLQETSHCKITIPFTSSTLWKDTHLYTSGDANEAADLSIVGYVYVFVLNPLVRPSNVSSAIEFNLYISGGDDLTMAVPMPNPMYLYAHAPPTDAEQSMALDRMTTRTAAANDKSTLSVAFGKATVPPKDFFGEQFSLLDYLKRYGITQRILVTATNTTARISVYPSSNNSVTFPQTGDYGLLDLYHTPLSSITSLFACWFGSIRYKYASSLPRTTTRWLQISHIPVNSRGNSFDGPLSGSGAAIQRTNMSQNNALEVEIPCYTPYNFLLTEITQQRTPGANETYPFRVGDMIWNIQPVIEGDDFMMEVYIAGGDDFKPFYLISPPQDYGYRPSNVPETQIDFHYTKPLRENDV